MVDSKIFEILGMDIVGPYRENTVILLVFLELAGVTRVPHFGHQR